jgi:hypothetical protein
MALQPVPKPSLVFYFVCRNPSCSWRGQWTRDSGKDWPAKCPYCTAKLRPVSPPSEEAKADPDYPPWSFN